MITGTVTNVIKLRNFVIPAKAGIHPDVNDSFTMDCGVRHNDDIFFVNLTALGG